MFSQIFLDHLPFSLSQQAENPPSLNSWLYTCRISSKANLLNSHFCSCFSHSSSVPSTVDLPPPTTTPGLSSVTCSPEDVYKLLTSLKKKRLPQDLMASPTLHFAILPQPSIPVSLTFLIGPSQAAPSHQNGNSLTSYQCLKVVIIVLTLHQATDPSHCCHCPRNCWNMLFITSSWAISYPITYCLLDSLVFDQGAQLKRPYSTSQTTGTTNWNSDQV